MPSRRPRVANRTLVKPREPHRLADLGRALLVIVLLAVPGFLYAYHQARLHRYRRAVTRLETHIDDAVERQRRLELELATLKDPERIESLARDVVGLVPAAQEQIVFLERPGSPLEDPFPFLAEAVGGRHGPSRR